MKPVIKIEITVRLTEDGLNALKKELKSVRKPKTSLIRRHFQELVDDEVGRLIEKWDDDGHADVENDEL